MDGWNTSFLLGWPIFRCYVSFREGKHWTICEHSESISLDEIRLSLDIEGFCLSVFDSKHFFLCWDYQLMVDWWFGLVVWDSRNTPK